METWRTQKTYRGPAPSRRKLSNKKFSKVRIWGHQHILPTEDGKRTKFNKKGIETIVTGESGWGKKKKKNKKKNKKKKKKIK